MPNEEELKIIEKLNKLIPDTKPEDFDPLPLGDKERAERLEAMVDRMSEKIVNLQLELTMYKEMYNGVAGDLNTVNHLISEISDVITKRPQKQSQCKHYFVDGACALCGVTITQFTTRA